MWRRLFVVGALAGGCWSSDPLIDNAFTPAQWAKLQQDFHYTGRAPTGCDQNPAKIALAQQLFSDTRLSGGQCALAKTPCWSNADCTTMAMDSCPAWTAISCASCHDQKVGWIDSRGINNTSQGSVGWTKRNAMTLWDVAFKPNGPHEFTWSGAYPTSGGVLDLAIKTPMSSTHQHVISVVMTDGSLAMQYQAAFFQPPSTADTTFTNLETAFTAFFCTNSFISGMTPFDWWLAGKDSPMTDSAKRGFAIFAGKGTCIECHDGPTFTDYQFHDTGVPQDGVHVPATDNGYGNVTMVADDNGKFQTGMLREITKTGPYMHDGVFQTLGDVIDFYRQGGVAGTFAGTRDPRIQPLDLTDQDAKDLEAFLGSLTECDGMNCATTGPSGGPDGGMATRDGGGGGGGCGYPYMACPTPMGAVCINTTSDPLNCGACGIVCPGTPCNNGICGAPPPPPDAAVCMPTTCPQLGAQCGAAGDGCGGVLNCGTCATTFECLNNQCVCPTGTTLCSGSCLDLSTDKNNCGTCGHACSGSHVCVNGMCQ